MKTVYEEDHYEESDQDGIFEIDERELAIQPEEEHEQQKDC